MMMTMMMMNCFCGMVDRRKAFSIISSRGRRQRSSPPRISDMLRAGFEPAQNLSSGLVERGCVVGITITPRFHFKSDFKSDFNSHFKSRFKSHFKSDFKLLSCNFKSGNFL